jgi:hypothetical protein
VRAVERIYHTWDKWECYPAGFYEDNPPRGMTPGGATQAYAEFLRDSMRFEAALKRVLAEWPNSCEHYLSNENMNRIAWLGQASMCIATRVPAAYRSGFNLLTKAEQDAADALALKYLNIWLESRAEPTLTQDTAKSKTVANLY